jgi:uncharacterized protein (DUF2252 family)
VTRLSVAERVEFGRAARAATPWSSHAEWQAAVDRPDPVMLLQAQNAQRIPWLVPVRHARMRQSPFTFYRGTASIMATDLAGTPVSGFEVQIGGDAHLLNFGAYASPERTLVFDANDFDETLHGPWEWDLKRLAASFVLAARHLELKQADVRAITQRAVSAYHRGMVRFGEMGFLELWYRHTTMSELRDLQATEADWKEFRIDKFERKAKSKNSLHALRKLTEEVDGRFRIRSDRPVLVPIREVMPDHGPDEIEQIVRETFADYLKSTRDDRRDLLERYELIDIALKVVGVGSVGTACYVLLLEGRDRGDPLFLQAKEANASVLEPHLHPSRYSHHGERVVQGQRRIQAQSDIFLGWATGTLGRQFFVRQLRDWKRSYDVERADRAGLEFYAQICGHVLARGHARSGDPVAIAAYMGDADRSERDGFDRAITAFAERYADWTLKDFERFESAIEDGTLAVSDDV